jgi:hypothetical protein
VWSALVAPVGFLALLVALDRPPQLDEAYRVRSALRLDATSREPPPASAAGVTVEVPDALALAGNELKRGWYRIRPTPAQRPPVPLALYAPEPDGNLAIYLDGAALADGGRLDRPAAYHEFPLVLRIPEGTALDAGSRLDVHTVRDGRYAHLPELYLGPAAELERSARYQWWVRAGIVRVAMVVALCLALLAMGFYLLRRADAAYGWFALALLAWVAHVWHDHVIQVPVARPLWLASTTVTLGAFVACAVMFVHRFVGVGTRRGERAIGLVWVLGTVAFFTSAAAAGWRFHGVLVRIWVPLVLVAGLYLVARLAQAAWRRPSLEHHALLGAALATLLIGVRDYLHDIRVLPAGSVFYLGYALMLVVVVFGAIVVRRFALAVGESEALSRELEQRVARKTRELESNYARLLALEGERARRLERESLLREMHDGIGGQLVQGMALAEHGGDADALRGVLDACLTDLRLMVDAVDVGDGEGDVLDLLARFRHRIGRRLDAAGIELDWAVADVAPTALGSAAAVQLLRILQDVFAAALRRHGTRRIRVATGTDAAGATWIEIRDDGRLGGGDLPEPGAGSKARVAQLGAELTTRREPDGTTVTLRLPAATAASVGSVS